MATTVSALLGAALHDLRFEPTAKRVRAYLGDDLVADSSAAVLVWEPRRVVPAYAVPRADVRADLAPAAEPSGDAPAGDGPVFPFVPFSVHTTPGTAHDVRTASGTATAAAFAPDDPDLAGHVVLDGDAFGWLEEDDEIHGHPRDPFHRVDVRRSTREVTVRVGGAVVARSSHPLVVFETSIPPRYYLPREDVLVDLMPTPTTSSCPYKGTASYWSVPAPDGSATEVAWSYEAPLPDAVAIEGAVAFYPDRADVVVGGV
ncbi:MAG: DUF427 domain-containing protein [Kineosporiaceae bacterium]